MRRHCLSGGGARCSCCETVYEQETRGLYRFGGRIWTGWRLQGGVLIGPGGVRWTPETLHHAKTWQEFGLAGLRELHQVIPVKEPRPGEAIPGVQGHAPAVALLISTACQGGGSDAAIGGGRAHTPTPPPIAALSCPPAPSQRV